MKDTQAQKVAEKRRYSVAGTRSRAEGGFADAPSPDYLERIIARWRQPELPPSIGHGRAGRITPAELASLLRRRLARARGGERTGLELVTLDWLYDFIRANVRRGRLFDLGDVLSQGEADCLGYAKLFTLLGRSFGLDVGVVEVVIDNAGRFVPHTITLVRLSAGERRFVDPWYGSKNANHIRVGVQVKAGVTWRIKDVDRDQLKTLESIRALPDRCADAVTHYIRGNRYLNGLEFDKAIEHYSEAIRLYPTNARFYFNRAVAHANRGEHDRAERDYARALKDDAGLLRVLAREHEEVVRLIALDSQGLVLEHQQAYLLHRGFVTGRAVPLELTARELGMSEAEARAAISEAEAATGESPQA